MKTKFSLTAISLLLIVALAACGGEAAATETADSSQLSANYTDALTVQGQLALGTMQLEGTELAVDTAQAAELHTLWQAVQSLSNSDTVTSVEIDAVVNQIQDTMRAEQIAAIAEMALTSDSLTALVESGDLELGRSGGVSAPEDADTSNMTRPEGDFAGGGPPDGAVPGDGFAGEDMTEEDMATRQAERESGELSGFQEQALVTAVIGLLEGKIS